MKIIHQCSVGRIIIVRYKYDSEEERSNHIKLATENNWHFNSANTLNNSATAVFIKRIYDDDNEGETL